MRKIILYGELRKKFGKEYNLNVSNGAAAVAALRKLVKGFESYMLEHSEPGFLVKIGKEYQDEESLRNPSAPTEVIRIMPYITGSKGAFKIILGAALIALALNPTSIGLGVGNLVAFGPESVLNFGISLVLSGVSEILFQPPKPPNPKEREKEKPSYAFDGPVNTVQQGNPVPVLYGKLLVGSQVISAVIIAKDI